MGNINKDTGITTQSKTWSRSAPSWWVGNASGSYIADSKRRYKNGVSIPNFHAKVARGELLPHTSFKQTEWEYEHLSGNLSLSGHPNGYWYTVSNFEGYDLPEVWRTRDYIDYDADPTSPPPTSIPDYFVQQAAARIYSQGFDALTASAEAAKTVSMFKGVSKRMLDLAKNFSTKRMLQLWLEGRYGWRTLAYDVRDLHSALQEFEAKREIWTERAGTSYSTSSSTATTYTTGDTTSELQTDIEHTWSLRGSVAGLIKPNRFIADPLLTGWELVPYSFVVDWVYDVGTAIQAQRFMQLATSWTASKGYQCNSTVNRKLTVLSPRNGYTSASGSVSYRGTGVTQSRGPISSIPTLPQVTGRALTPDLALDLQALSRLRSRF